MGYHNLLLPASRQHRSTAAVRGEDTSYQPLQPTCCQQVPAGTPYSQASGSHLSDRGDLPCASPRAFARASAHAHPPRRRIAVAGISGPEWWRGWRRASSCGQHYRPSRGCPVSRAPARVGFVDPTRAWRPDLQTPLVAPSSLTRHPELVPTGPRPSPRAAYHGRTRFLDPRRLPPAGPLVLGPRLRSGRGLRAATGTPTSPPWAQLSTCVHARLRRTLGSSPCRLSPEYLGHMPPTDFCNRVSPEHSHESPKPRRLIAAANRCATEWPRPLRASTNRASSGQGSLRRYRLSNPHRDNRLPRWIYPNLIDSGTPCHELVPNHAWNVA